MAIDITDLGKSNRELRSTVRYFDQIQRASERLGRIQYQNIMKLNNELRFTIRYFDNVYRIALKLSRLRLMPTVTLNDKATPAIERLLRKLRSIRDEAIHASGHYTVRQKLDVFIKGLKIPPSPPATITINPSLLAASSSSSASATATATGGSGSGTKDGPKGFWGTVDDIFKKIVEYIDSFNKIVDAGKNIAELFNMFRNKDSGGESGSGDSNAGRAANGNKKCCCCCNGGNGGGSNRGGNDDRRNSRNGRGGNGRNNGNNRNNRNGRNNGGNGNGRGGNRGGSRGGRGGRLGGFLGRIGERVGGFFGRGRDAAGNNREGLLSKGLGGLKNLGGKIAGGATAGWKKAKEFLGGNGTDKKGIFAGGLDKLKGLVQNPKMNKAWDGLKGFTEKAGKGLAKGAGKIFRPLGAIMDIADIATASNGKERGAAIGSMIAGALGSVGGGLLGSVVPVAGTAAGSIAGGMLLSSAGEWLGGKIGGWFDNKKAAAAAPVVPKAPVAAASAIAATSTAMTAATAPAVPVNSATVQNATGKTQPIQIDANQMSAISSSLKDFKAEVTNAVSITIPPGAVQLTVKENELDYDALAMQVGQKVASELRKSLQNRKPDSSGGTTAKPIMA